MWRPRFPERSVPWIVLWIGTGSFVLGLLLTIAGAAVFDLPVLTKVGWALVLVGVLPALLQARFLIYGNYYVHPLESVLEHEADDWERIRRGGARARRRMLRENPPKPRSSAPPGEEQGADAR